MAIGDLRNVGILCKPGLTGTGPLLRSLVGWLEDRKIEVRLDADASRILGLRSSVARDRLAARSDLLIAIGGDGTMLAVARAACVNGTPILGVNFGGLGFLTEVARDEMIPAMEEILEGRCVLETRMMLTAKTYRKRRLLSTISVLNDIVINKSALARIIDLSVSIDGRYVTNYRADGLIVATPTGSTAYSLSAGGPIVVPTLEALLLTPIAPHTLAHRPLLVNHTAKVDLSLVTADKDVYLTFDGQVGQPVRSGDRISISRSARDIKLVRRLDSDYFDVLRRKLKWGAR